MDDRKRAEREFHDRIRTVAGDVHVSDTRWSLALEPTIRDNPLWANMKYYSIERASRAFILDWYRANCRGKVVLDYCCGNGEDSIELARAGAAKVVGIDISEVSVENCRQLAEREGVADRCEFVVADAEATGFPDHMFDVINEYGSLHHLDLTKAMPELARILRPDGKIICDETLGHNPLIAAYRRATPDLRTPWEVDHILKREHFRLMGSYFRGVDLHFFHLATLFAVPFRKSPVFGPMLRFLETVDSLILKVPGLRWQAWQAVAILSGPETRDA
jgi:ubiquinone/menaquinone biosynthesis C-methylase UbiE